MLARSPDITVFTEWGNYFSSRFRLIFAMSYDAGITTNIAKNPRTYIISDIIDLSPIHPVQILHNCRLHLVI